MQQAWPGNVRQLQNTLLRALILAEHVIEPADLELRAAPEQPARGAAFPTLAELEAGHVRAALERAAGNKSAAARLLGISRPILRRKCAEYGLGPGD